MGKGKKSLLCDPGSELRRKRKKKGEDYKWDGKERKKKKVAPVAVYFINYTKRKYRSIRLPLPGGRVGQDVIR